MNRVREFGAGVLAVRASMTGVPDRTSFTRFRVLSSAGTWHGVNPSNQHAGHD